MMRFDELAERLTPGHRRPVHQVPAGSSKLLRHKAGYRLLNLSIEWIKEKVGQPTYQHQVPHKGHVFLLYEVDEGLAVIGGEILVESDGRQVIEDGMINLATRST